VFGDFADLEDITVIAFNQDSCPDGNLMPLNSEYLNSMGISQAEYEGMDYMSHWLILIPFAFLLLGCFMGFFIKCVEKMIRA